MGGECKQPTESDGPLSGITVLDASRVLVGPFCTMQLGDLGADVLKVERPGTGDQTRDWRPPAFDDESAYYLSVNRNKRSIALNLATRAGREVFRDLAREADVLVENFRVGKMAEWDLEYSSLREENPGLVYCSLSGYGEWGPDHDEPAYDIVMQARGGLMSVTGIEDGPPVRVGVALADIGAGMYATQAILAALLERELGDGTGQKIDVSLLDGQVAWMSYQALNYFATGDPPGRMGSRHPNIVPYRAFETVDGYVVVACASNGFWRPFCEAIDRPDLADIDRFDANEKRVRNREELEPMLETEIRSFRTEELLDRLKERGVPASDVRDMSEVFADPQIEARGMCWTAEHPTAGEVSMPGSPMHFSRTPASLRRYPPRLGEHTDEILKEYGYTGADLAELCNLDAIAGVE
ncbi:Succinyl-CoA:mesaconate CoA-transferase or predicted acyl-CoA transferase/carnitine dehydratase [Halalkaliarchaeum sp. AArc-CO]|uniref:CaiB/BaiF CoA transferase family protein n=1 Tax=unclassified Halalkaliarchaeum TaxID=2678344 RepID=UPI00217E4015|nr:MULTISPECIES: CoA transferase [unclassified Halalkaliarchaeum]MDR5674184.1 CoA transferase [Halalkaliarchaeum sp. AArc-GB]UWG50901.1 Succinyl-CoA:mesaconate CoA-transferase or predicted acyl-CoA transferase/carnitine dehydratase [Halalkaliarchaeum sp. AArc-CO]